MVPLLQGDVDQNEQFTILIHARFDHKDSRGEADGQGLMNARDGKSRIRGRNYQCAGSCAHVPDADAPIATGTCDKMLAIASEMA
jgi:hypothetical protein